MRGNRRGTRALVFLIVGLCLPLSGIAHGSGFRGRKPHPDPLSRVERSFLRAHGPIRYAPDPNFAPLEFFDREGRAEGITPDILNRIAENLDITITVVKYPTWSDVLDATREGKVDVLGSLTKTPGREAFLDYSRSYIDVPYVLFVNEKSHSVNSLEACRGKRLGVVTNYGIVDWLRAKHPRLTLSFAPDPQTGLLDVATGRLDAFVETLPVGAYYIRKDALATVRMVHKPLYVMPQYLAVPKGEKVLLGILQKGLDTLSPEDYERVVVHWTGHSLTFRPWYSTREARGALAVFLIVIAALLVWVASLRHMVSRHKRRLTATEALLRRFVERTQAAIYRTTPDGRILDCNEAFAEIFGFATKEAARKVDAWSLYPSAADREADLTRLRTEGCLDHHEVRLLRRDGSEIFAIESESLVTNEGDEPVIEGVLLDITTLKSTQEALQTANMRLEEEIEHRARQEAEHLEMSARIHQLQTLEAIGRLTQGLAHEVRNPLFALQVNVAALEKMLAQGRPPGPFIAHIREHIARLDGLMRDLMDLGRSRNDGERVECDLAELVRRACASMEKSVRDKPVHIAVESPSDPVTIEASPQDMVQVFLRLLRNAVDASSRNSHIRVSVSTDEDRAVVRITDSGSGIPEKLLPHLFEPFLSGKKGHGGLGLALARHFLEANGGTIEAANNNPGPGAVFTVTLPLSP